ncbi:hypothetical protein ACA910_021532 [Epithemia clementina (nom. ined.)]
MQARSPVDDSLARRETDRDPTTTSSVLHDHPATETGNGTRFGKFGLEEEKEEDMNMYNSQTSRSKGISGNQPQATAGAGKDPDGFKLGSVEITDPASSTSALFDQAAQVSQESEYRADDEQYAGASVSSGEEYYEEEVAVEDNDDQEENTTTSDGAAQQQPGSTQYLNRFDEDGNDGDVAVTSVRGAPEFRWIQRANSDNDENAVASHSDVIFIRSGEQQRQYLEQQQQQGNYNVGRRVSGLQSPPGGEQRRRRSLLTFLCIPCMFFFSLFMIFMILIFMGLPFCLFLMCLLTAYYCCTSDPLPPRVLLRALMDNDDWNAAATGFPGAGGSGSGMYRRFTSKQEIHKELIQRICLGSIKVFGGGPNFDEETIIGKNVQSVDHSHSGRVHWRFEPDNNDHTKRPDQQQQHSQGVEYECLVFSAPLQKDRDDVALKIDDSVQEELNQFKSFALGTVKKDDKGKKNHTNECIDVEVGGGGRLKSTSQHHSQPPATSGELPQIRKDNPGIEGGEGDDENDHHRHHNNDDAETMSSVRQRGTGCDICLLEFESGDVIAWSTNPNCDHAYHSDCISDWLLRQPTCPSCRQEYLPSPPSSDNEDDHDEENPFADDGDDLDEEEISSDVFLSSSSASSSSSSSSTASTLSALPEPSHNGVATSEEEGLVQTPTGSNSNNNASSDSATAAAAASVEEESPSVDADNLHLSPSSPGIATATPPSAEVAADVDSQASGPLTGPQLSEHVTHADENEHQNQSQQPKALSIPQSADELELETKKMPVEEHRCAADS